MLPLLLFLSLFFNSLPPSNSLNSEGSALLSLKQSLTDPEGSLSNWNSSDANPCSWKGVTCNFLKVISISIPKSKLHGSLPSSSLGSLSQLRHLNFRSNKLFGTIPTDLFHALKLQSLVLYDNSFSGYVPNEIGNLRYIQTLDLSQNFFNGSFPNAIISCKRLQFLDLSENNFSGSIPNGFGTNLVSLELLDLSFNNFSGLIPSDLGNLSSLQGTVDLSHNHFRGEIPPSLGNLPEKVYIDLTFNNLSGPIPQNGALVNRGPTAFIGNPSLCGPPLKNPCSNSETHANNSSTSSASSLPSFPDNNNSSKKSENHKAKGLSKISVIAIVVGDLVGILLLGLLFSYCYSRIFSGSDQVKDENIGIEKEEIKGKKNCLFFRTKDESETLSDNLEHINHNNNNKELVALDAQVGFDLDELLKASAFVLGKSEIGIVYKVVLEDGVTTLAVRRLGEGGSQRLKEFQNEVETIGKLRHPNVVTLRAYYWSVDEKLLIYDFVPNGSLASAIHGKAGLVTFTPLSWSMRLKIMKGIAKGLVYLHEFSPKKFVHGDLKPSNILLGQNMEPHISDFGLGRLANIAGSGGPMTLQSNRVAAEKPQERHKRMSSSSEVTTTSTLGNGYRAPESLKVMMKPSQKWDVYSYGVILLEMITGRLPVVQVNNSEMDLVQWIEFCIEEKKPFKDVLDPYLAQDDADDREEEIVAVLKMAMACVHGSPEKRPTMRHVLDSLHRLSSVS